MSTNQESFFQSLIERRFFRYIISYLVTGWALLQFVEFIVSNYNYSRIWIDGTLVFLLALLPSIILLTYYHGRPGKDRVRNIEKFFVPLNFVAAIFAVVFLFNGKELGAVVNKVTVTDEEGKEVERFVPKNSQSKRIVVFPLDIKGDDPELESLQFSIPLLQCTDLEQDNRIFTLSPADLDYEYKSYGYQLFDKIPLSIQRKIAGDNYSDFFLTGTIDKKEDTYFLNAKLISTETGKPFFTKEYSSADPFELIDILSTDFRNEVYLKDASNETFLDMPATDLYSSSTEAIDAYQKGIREIVVHNNYSLAEQHLNEAISHDKNFAMAHFKLFDALMMDSKQTEAKPHIEKAMDYLDALSERQQLEIKYNYLDLTDVDKSLSLLEMWTKIYPADARPHLMLMNVRQGRMEFDKAIKTGEEAIENGHTGRILLTMARIYTQKQESKKALEYYERFEKEFPHKASEVANLAYIYMTDGENQKAKEFLEKLNTLNPNDVETLIGLGNVARNQSQFKKAYDFYNQALEQSKQAKDSMMVLQTMEMTLMSTGRIKESIEIMTQRYSIAERNVPPIMFANLKISFFTLQKYILIGEDEKLIPIIEESVKDIDFDRVDLKCLAYLNYNILKENVEEVERYYKSCEENIKSLQGGTDLLVGAFIDFLKGNYEQSINGFNELTALTGIPDQGISMYNCRSYLALGKIEEAEKIIDKVLVSNPTNTEVLQRKLDVLIAKENKEEAQNVYDQLMEIWKDADPEYIYAKEAREKFATLD